MVLYASARLEGYPEYWQVGHRLIDLVVTRAHQEQASSVRVTIADPGNEIAAKIIEHVEKAGGIQALPEAKPTALGTPNAAQAPSGQVSPTNGDRMPSGDVAATELSPQEKAFLDTIAYTEGACIKSKANGYDTVLGYRHNVQNFANHPHLTGEFDPLAACIAAGGRQDHCSDAAGRYQFLSTTWAALGQPDFSPASQDRAAIQLMKENGSHAALMAGNVDQAFALAAPTWVSLPGNSGVDQPQVDGQTARQVYEQRLAYYQGTAGSTAATGATAAPTETAADILESLGGPGTSAKPAQVFKGKKLLIVIEDRSFEFFHQGTETDQNGVTVLTGQGGRWVMNRRKRNRTHKDVSLRKLAEQVCKEHGLTLEWLADFEPEYTFIDQSGISDYELLLREVKANGLFITDGSAVPGEKSTGTKLTIKSLRQMRDSKIILARGNNLINYKISDKPLNKEDTVEGQAGQGTSVGVSDPKVLTDMMTGKMVESGAKEIDPAKSPTSLTGTPAEQPTGKPKPGGEAVAQQNKARVKRVKGLPSTFTVPLGVESLDLQPLDVVRTVDLPGKLSRVWMVDQVTHSLAQGTSVLQVFSPVEVLDAGPAAVASSGPGQAAIAGQPGRHVCPCDGWAGDGWDDTGAKYGRRHGGVDIATDLGTPIYASLEGKVVEIADGYGTGYLGNSEGGGFGNFVTIVHPDGFQTLYSHLLAGSIKVKAGDQVTQGQHIAGMGTSGSSSGSHLHFQFESIGQRGGIGIDPTQFGWGWTAGTQVKAGSIPT